MLKNLFDYYAVYYDKHMSEVLKYNLPEIIHETFKKYQLHNQLKTPMISGSGVVVTGKMGIEFYPYAKTLVGVDLSEKNDSSSQGKKIFIVI